MSKQIIKLIHTTAKQKALRAVANAPDGWMVEVKKPTRTLEQNAMLWPLLTEVSKSVNWYGRQFCPQEWKQMFTAALQKQDAVAGIDGGVVVLGQSTSEMSKRMFSKLLELVYVFGAQHGVVFKEEDWEEGLEKDLTVRGA